MAASPTSPAFVPTLSLCQQSSFSAETTPITIVPAFSHATPLPLFSSLHTSSKQQQKQKQQQQQQSSVVGPFVAGMPLSVPLWMAKILHQKQLAQIQLPEWLSVDFLTQILQQEKTSPLLTTQLPFYYYEIARSLAHLLNTSESSGGMTTWNNNNNNNDENNHHHLYYTGSSTNGLQTKAVLVLLQDLVSLRIDKIRQNFHQLSKETLEQQPDDDDDDDDELPMIAVTGICSVELNKVGPFLQRAFGDYGYLTKRTTTTTPIETDDTRTSPSKEQDKSQTPTTTHLTDDLNNKPRSSVLRRFRQ